MAAVFAGLLISVTGKMLDIRWLAFAGLYVMVAGMFGVVAFGMLRQTRRRKRGTTDNAQPEQLVAADTTNKLKLPVGNNDYIPSVVEGTTDLLKTPVSPRSDSGSL